jgi:hypothetical protein
MNQKFNPEKPFAIKDYQNTPHNDHGKRDMTPTK